jgi:hypothetical protein
MKLPTLLPTLLLVAGLALPAAAQTVWRCGAGVYGDRPCADGQAIDVADPRSDEQRLHAALVAQRGQRLAEELRAERLVRHAQATPLPAAAVFKRPPDRAAAKSPAKDRPKARKASKRPPDAADGTWRAAAPVSRRARD